MPQQNGGMGSKKKWSNGASSGSGGGAGTGLNGNMASSKMHHYHHHQMSPSYHPTSMSSTSSVGSTSAENTMGKSSVSRSDQYKFEISKLSFTLSDKVEFPLFFNATPEEFEVARSKRYQLRMNAFDVRRQTGEAKKLEFKKAESMKSNDSLTEKNNVDQPLNTATPEILTKEVTKDSPKQSSKDTPKDSPKELPRELPFVEAKESPKESPKNTGLDLEASIHPIVPKTPKLWSTVASGGITKSKITPGLNSQHSTSFSQSTQVPQKKEKKYIPPTTKGVETLGSVALRMCYDPDYIDYTSKNLANENGSLCVRSVAPRGIINRANICFMSSVLQVLLYCRPFINILNVVSASNVLAKANSEQPKLLEACINMYRQFDTETMEIERKNANKTKQSNVVASISEAIKPDDFYKSLSTIPKFKDLKWGHQEDAEEFLTHLLDQLHEEFISAICSLSDNEIQNLLQSINDEELRIFFVRNLPRYKKAEFLKSSSSQLKDLISTYGSVTYETNEEGDGWHEVSGSSKKGKKTKAAAKRTVEMEPSPMSCLFGGQFRSVLDIPNNKESQSITLDPFQTIQLDISDRSVTDLETAFKKFSEYELLPFKSSSGYDVEAKKQTFIDKLPQVLLIQLKRFQFINNTEKDNSMVNYNAYSGRIEKIRKKINYDHELVIPAETISSINRGESRLYHLTGVIYHHGVSSDGGHYTADVYHKETDQWYRIDDVNITDLKKEEVLKGGEDNADSRTAYILMYQKA